MATPSEYNQFRRLIGKTNVDILDNEIEVWLADATRELTSDFVPSPVTDIDNLAVIYHPEVVLYAAINWWWNYASQQAEKHTTVIGQESEQKGTRFDRAMQMIDKLQARYDKIQALGTDITVGNLSRWTKQGLYRIGGMSEEDAMNG